MDLLTFIGWTILFYLAYKLGVYVDRKLKAKREATAAQPDAGSDSEQKR